MISATADLSVGSLWSSSSATACLSSSSSKVQIISGSNPSTFPSWIPFATVYLCINSPNKSVVVLPFFSFSGRIGVPVKPKKTAFGNVFLIVIIISPNVERWHSSTIKTICFFRIISQSFCFERLYSSSMLLIFWIDVTISVSEASVLFNLLKSTVVSSVPWTDSVASAKLRYSDSDCVPSSILSIRKTTLCASWELAISCAALKLVIVLPLPVVCHTWPPSCCLPSQSLIFATLSDIPEAA